MVTGSGTRRSAFGQSPEEAIVRRLLKEILSQNRRGIEAALRRRFRNPATVQDMVELLARLEGELP